LYASVGPPETSLKIVTIVIWYDGWELILVAPIQQGRSWKALITVRANKHGDTKAIEKGFLESNFLIVVVALVTMVIVGAKGYKI
jgi:hypothetical protein